MRMRLDAADTVDGLAVAAGVREAADGWEGACSCRGFTTTGWPTKARAEARVGQHLEEHATGEPADELATFRGDTPAAVDLRPFPDEPAPRRTRKG